MKKNVCILFSGGSYGTFIEWCLNYFTDINFPSTLPFNQIGNSHKFSGHHCIDINGVRAFINSDLEYPFVRSHLRSAEEQNTIDDFRFIYDNFNKVIYLHCTVNSIIWNMNNKFEKIWIDGWFAHNNSAIVSNLKQWNPQATAESCLQPWELREFLSYFLYDQHIAESDLTNLEEFQSNFPNAIFVPIESLRDNFTQTLFDLIKKLDLPLVRTNVTEIYNEWAKVQYHFDKDKLVNDIIQTLLHGGYMSWSNLTMVDEAMIQYFLRRYGYELKCHGLNNFPNNSIDLKAYMYELT